MKRSHIWAIRTLLLYVLASTVWAAPRVAIVTPLSGDVWLGETLLRSPKIAQEGEKVILGDGGKVRLQLLGSSKETTISGNSLFTVSKATLERDGKSLSRGSVTVSEEIGSLTTSASATARREGWDSYAPVGFTLNLPPVAIDEGWQTKVASFPAVLNSDEAFEIELEDCTDSDRSELEVTIDEPIASLEFGTDDLTLGHRYRLHVKGPKGGYTRYFQILTAEERAGLEKTAQTMRAEAEESDELPVLLRLANLYSSFDETEQVAKILLEVVESPAYLQLDPKDQGEVESALNQALRSLDIKNHRQPGPKPAP